MQLELLNHPNQTPIQEWTLRHGFLKEHAYLSDILYVGPFGHVKEIVMSNQNFITFSYACNLTHFVLACSCDFVALYPFHKSTSTYDQAMHVKRAVLGRKLVRNHVEPWNFIAWF